MLSSALVSTDWLATHLASPDVRVVDATWVLPDSGRDARAEFEQRHIPGAVYFDIDDVSDESSTLPHMVPSAAKFSARARRLGLGDGARVVVYDDNTFFASARVWWMFKLFGHGDVAVLDGGLKKWIAEERPVDDLPRAPTERHYTARENTLILRNLDQMRRNLTTKREQVVDSRSPGRFRGDEPEPRQGLRAGHIPGSVNVPYSQLVDADERTLLPVDTLKEAFEAAGLDLGKPITSTCGSGVSAAIVNLALYELGHADTALYDGSWTEWGSEKDTPVATG
ncbi:MAG: 3-mercaptopyruvate sulfurtransferase [Pseudomonadota bacterium]